MLLCVVFIIFTEGVELEYRALRVNGGLSALFTYLYASSGGGGRGVRELTPRV